jgi:hypothetical protein
LGVIPRWRDDTPYLFYGQPIRRATSSLTARGISALAFPPVEDAQFQNIDLDVRSRRSLAPLLEALGEWARRPIPDESRWIILNARGSAKGADGVARLLLKHIESLRGEARRCWRDAHRRVFDIGIQAGGAGSRAFEEVRLTADTMRRIAAVDAEVQITVYPPQPESEDYIPPRRKASKRR